MSVSFSRVGSVGVVQLEQPPVNAIGLAVRQGLMDALDQVDLEKGLSHVVLTGGDRIFAAGADACEFDAPPVAPHLPDVVSRIENCAVPWVAAINGAALGGGCELAMACRYRIAHPKAQIGLPEVTLGVVPGAGGTQRLPRLIGLKAALDMISFGKPVTGVKAQDLGLVNGIADDPLKVALHLDLGTISLSEIVSHRTIPDADPEAIDAARALVAVKSAKQIAPSTAIDLVALSLELPFDIAIKQERGAFVSLRQGEQAKGLRHIFFAERQAKIPANLKGLDPEVNLVTVVGGGNMGAAISYALLNAGFRVVLLETDEDGADRATANVERIIAASLKRRLISEEDAVKFRAALRISTSYEEAKDADIAIEAAFESIDVKKQIFAQLQAHLSSDAILATNTSYLDVDAIANTLDDPGRLLGLHFFAPAHIMKLLEIVQGRATRPEVLAAGFALGKRLKKIPVVAGVCDGFIGNRILARYREAADTVLIEGATPWEVDEAMEAFGYAMGPYEAQDLSGLDIAHANRRRQDATRDPIRRYIPIADRMVELGKLGKKTGAGWYRYPGGGGKVEDPIVADLALEEARFAGITARDFSPQEISERLLLAMINEAADILYEGIAASAADIDLVTVFGYGFPRWRGGLMHYADHLGVEGILAKLEELSQEDAVVWKPSPLIVDCVAAGKTIGGWTRKN